MTGKGDKRLHARTQADADTMAAKWAATFGVGNWTTKPDAWHDDTVPLTADERDAMWRAGTHIQRGRDT